MKKNSEIRLKLTSEELEKIKRNADKIGYTLQEYLLRVALDTEIRITIKSRE